MPGAASLRGWPQEGGLVALCFLYDERPSPDFNLPGITLVDEIENHLRLSLQKRVLPTLVELFPNVQFVVSTHSPFVLSSLGGAVVYDLENHARAANGLSGNTYESIVEGHFSVDSLSKELRQKYDRYRELAARDSLSDTEFLEVRRLERYLNIPAQTGRYPIVLHS